MTNDLQRRVDQHNAGRGARYTRARRPVALFYSEPAVDRSAAQRREFQLRRLPRAAKLRLRPGARSPEPGA